MMEQILLEKAVEYLTPIAVALLSLALASVTRWVQKRTKNEDINNAISRVCHMTDTTVAEISQLFVAELKAKNGGTLSKQDILRLRRRAIKYVENRLAPEVLKTAGKGVTDLRSFIVARIERAVWEQKAAPTPGSSTG